MQKNSQDQATRLKMPNLFEPHQTPMDERYSLVRDDLRFHQEKAFLEHLWKSFEPFADPDFKSELAKQFHPRFWEMYLACTLIESGFDLIPRKCAYGPDIHFIYHKKNFWIEATAPDAGSGVDAVPGNSRNSNGFRVPEEQIILRLTNSINKKNRKYKEYLASGLISGEDVFIIAINGSDIPYIGSDFEDEPPFIAKSVLPIGDLTASIDFKIMKPVDTFYSYRGHIEKRSGANVSTRAFQNPDFSYISGIIFSIAGIWKLPKSLGYDFSFVHNPLAEQKIALDWLRKGRTIWVEDNQLKFKTLNKSIH